MEEIIKYIITNIVILAPIGLFAKKHFENYINNKVKYELQKSLESHKLELQKEMESYKEKLNISRQHMDNYIKINNNFTNVLNDFLVSINNIIRTQQVSPNLMNNAWDEYMSKIPLLDDFLVKYQTTYLFSHNEDIINLHNAINTNTELIKESQENGTYETKGNFQSIIKIIEKIKKDIHINLTKDSLLN